MEEHLVDWSRAQFALTAMYHWIFVPLTLGLGFIVAIMETIYVKTNDEFWKKTTKFWMGLFAINFAIGVATGLIMEFEFGTNWANYSWFVGDIFGAPLAIEGIFAFFLESTFFAVMFFGWNKVSKGFHLLSTWLVAVGSNLSALWILVANGWMQYPTGMTFNPNTVRNEMNNFWDVLFSPVAISKFLHTIGSGYVLASLFVIGISAWYLLKDRDILFAKKSMIIGASFGLVTSFFLILSGDESAHQVALKQPMKLAAIEGLYEGKEDAGIVAFGILNPKKTISNNEEAFLFEFTIPYALSLLSYHNINAYVPGIKDLVYGNEEQGIISTEEKMQKGKIAINSLENYKEAKDSNNQLLQNESKVLLEENMKYFGYGHIKNKEDVIPPIAISFYSFHIMVALGMWFTLLFIIVLFFLTKRDIMKYPIILKSALWSIPLGYIASEAGWIVAEVGRQPWAIQDLMPVGIAATKIASTNVMISFFVFAILFTVLLIAEIKIMTKQIGLGPESKEH
ncbi:cyanide-insensitive cytochrome oxidase CioAB, subunit I [Arcobacter venerupis]|uniref:Cyanide-insensitive cytochrome oxidase CioAB, subunit I n=1 Tax=Arcobacter venerupis TaxID=1054033 RepID=A0AAE7B5U1_9BACT|nr:cytochrome ubiquinol oxidase subunit I [Arcobacter venerupis]QKF65864.1 cyanide-insensitive cytochrome oxidase CioAB, subunit I [Arcobacter venerupis]QKF67236.1 cyanide-insensitive cytochrome oxidase CioAB, subunit I [Arcobacter venerupis]RWS48127.1 cytochrome ubiquinol oxidase subunit I [Arcobacter venerupis]